MSVDINTSIVHVPARTPLRELVRIAAQTHSRGVATPPNSQVESHLNAAEMLLSEIAEVNRQMEKLSGMSGDTDTSVKQSLAHVQDEFRRLRLWYLGCETRQGFLESVAKENVLHIATSEAVSVKENAVNAGIEKVKLAAAQLTQIKADLTATIQALVLKWKQLQQQQVAISTMMSESSTEQLVKQSHVTEMQQKNSTSPCFGRCDPSLLYMDSEEKCHQILGAQSTMMSKIETSSQSVREQIKELEWQIAPLRQTVLKLRGEVEAQERKEKVVETSAKMDSDLEGTLVWYTSMRQILNKLGNAQVEWDPQRSSLQLVTEGHVIAIQYNASCSSFHKVEVYPHRSSETTLPLASLSPCSHSAVVGDIIQYAMHTQDVSLLVSEVQMRLQRCNARKALVDELSQRYTVLVFSHVECQPLSSSTSSVGVESPFSTLVVGIRSIAAEQIRYSYAVHLRISPDFPVPEYLLECSPPAITLQSVEPCNPNIKQLSKEALDNLKAEVNRVNYSSLTQLVDFIEGKMISM